jgi:serine/threonine protein kinase
MKCGKAFDAELVLCPDDGGVLLTNSKLADPMLGTTLMDRYEIMDVAGKGGMGVVYRARHTGLDRVVAVKVLKADLIYDEKSSLRFQVEALAASRLKHPNVISVYDYGVSPSGQPFLVMDLIEGESLTQFITPETLMDYKRAVPIFMQTCSALEHAHRNEIIHRDVKPSNIILVDLEGQRDHVLIVDFGIAQLGLLADDGLRLTQTGEIFGSPLYMSPEQCMGEKIDKRTDVYSLGAVMYEVLTGVPPLMGKTSVDTIRRKLSENAKPFKIARPQVNVPEPLEGVVLKALAIEPKHRFQSMDELRSAIEAAMRGDTVVALNTSTGLPEIGKTDFSNIDQQLELESEKKTMSVDKIKARAKAEAFLGVEKERAEEGSAVNLEILKDIDDVKKKPLPNFLAPVAGAIILIAVGCWFFLFGGKQLLMPEHTNSKSESAKVTGKIEKLMVRGKKRTLTVESKTGWVSLSADGGTVINGTLRNGVVATVVYWNKNGNNHAVKITVQTR